MKDEEAKKRLGYSDLRSKVRPDGSEILYGKDWAKRKQELWDRAGGRCEQITGLIYPLSLGERCRSEGHDPHHKVKRSRKRDDRLENLQLLCRLHHDLLDSRKPQMRGKLP